MKREVQFGAASIGSLPPLIVSHRAVNTREMATMTDPPNTVQPQSDHYWFVEVWREVRPFIIRLIADFAMFAVMWMLLVAAHALTAWLPLQTALSWLVLIVHEGGLVLTFLWLSIRAFCEIIRLGKEGVVDVLSRLTKRG